MKQSENNLVESESGNESRLTLSEYMSSWEEKK